MREGEEERRRQVAGGEKVEDEENWSRRGGGEEVAAAQEKNGLSRLHVNIVTSAVTELIQRNKMDCGLDDRKSCDTQTGSSLTQ